MWLSYGIPSVQAITHDADYKDKCGSEQDAVIHEGHEECLAHCMRFQKQRIYAWWPSPALTNILGLSRSVRGTRNMGALFCNFADI